MATLASGSEGAAIAIEENAVRLKRRYGRTYCAFQVLALGLAFMMLCVISQPRAEEEDAVAALVGDWDVRGTATSFEIRADHSVYHSRLGRGDIRHENVHFFTVEYRHTHLQCHYQIKKYSKNELSIVVTIHPSHQDCELGEMRRAPGSKKPKSDVREESKADVSTKSQTNDSAESKFDASTKSQTNDSAESKVDASTKNEKEGAEPVSKPKASSSTSAHVLKAEEEKNLRPEAVFKECDACPEMIVVPAGAFLMGSPNEEAGRSKSEGPVHKVALARIFAVGRNAVTRDEFLAFVTETNYPYGQNCYAEVDNKWVNESGASFLTPPRFSQEGNHPAVCVSWQDAQEYARWLSAKTGKEYRLLTEAEREYIARAGTSTPYWWGASVTPQQANYDTRQRGSPGKGNANLQQVASEKINRTPNSSLRGKTSAADSFSPNPWGLFNVHGNAAEWVQDCWNATYVGVPADGSSARTGDCTRRVVRGGAWSYWPEDIRAASRDAANMNDRRFHVGFRVARPLN